MRNNEEQIQDEKLLSFPLNLLRGLQSFDVKRYRKMERFFSKAYIDLSGSEFFDDKDYREEWQENLMYLENSAIPFKDYSSKEISQALDIAMKVLEKNREEVLNAK